MPMKRTSTWFQLFSNQQSYRILQADQQYEEGISHGSILVEMSETEIFYEKKN
jgi:hypothetical protein